MRHAHSIEILAPVSRFYQGPYGRIFPSLPPWQPALAAGTSIEKHLEGMASHMREASTAQAIEMALDANPMEATETVPGSRIPAGYTYFGQFIDHDITFDPASSLMRQNDPSGLLNHRTPRLDLDCLYGAGPAAHPHLYQREDPALFLIGSAKDNTALPDLPRTTDEIALIGDPRNDENIIVAQLHLAFLRAHNTLVRRAKKLGFAQPFERARTTLRWLYQYIVWHDFIHRIARADIAKSALKRTRSKHGRVQWERGLKDIYNWKQQPFMPVEFSVAAYRFGHSMVRETYRTNLPHRGRDVEIPLFSGVAKSDGSDLRGSRQLAARDCIQWNWFLQMVSTPRDEFPLRARRIDPLVSNALFKLPGHASDNLMSNLAYRNLLRGYRFDLPSGQSVARYLGIHSAPQRNSKEDPLWLYILKEAQRETNGESLGTVGSIIVCATFAGLLAGDPNAYFHVDPDWIPDNDPLLQKSSDNIDLDPTHRNPGDWKLSAIIRLANLPISADDF